jgi:hypothetical protein
MAEGILAQLKVLLGLDSSKLKTGLDESAILAKKSAGKVEGEFRSLASSIQRLLSPFGNIGGPIASSLSAVGRSAGEATRSLGSLGGTLALVGGAGVVAAGGLAAGLFALAIKAADVGAKIYDASEKTGMGARAMSGLMAVAKETGGDFDGLTSSLARAGANLAGLREHGAKSADKMNLLGRAAQTAGDSALKPMGNRIHDVVKEILSWNNSADRNRALTELLGRNWMNNITTLEAWANAADGGAAAAQRLGINFDDEHARQAKNFQVELKLLEGEAAGLALTLGNKLLPTLTRMLLVLVGMGPTISNIADKMGHWYSMIGPMAAVQFFRGLTGSSKEATQAMTDFLTQVDALTRTFAKSGEEGKPGRAKPHKEKFDALAALIAKEKDQLDEMDIENLGIRKLTREYDLIIEEINKAVKAHGSETEALQAKTLALEIYLRKLGEYATAHRDLTPPAAPTLKTSIPTTMPDLGTIFAKPLPPGTLTQLEHLNVDTSKFRSSEEALNKEYQLSYSSLEELKKIFGDLAPAEIAATREGQKWINALTRMEEQGKSLDFGKAFRGQLDAMIADGDKFAENLAQIFRQTVNDINNQLARLATGEKITAKNWKEMRTGIEQKLIGAGLQKAEGTVISTIFGKSDMGGKPTGSRSQPFYVRILDKMGFTPIHPATEGGGGNAGGGIGGLGGIAQVLSRLLRPAGGNASAPMVNGLADLSGALNPSTTGSMDDTSVFAQIFAKLGSSISSGLGSLVGLFGGFLAEGGDVTPGKAYVVGERHPEFFIPRASGAVVPSLRAQQVRPLTYAPTYNINTPDPDSFRRSQAQIAAEGYRHVAMLHARNG